MLRCTRIVLVLVVAVVAGGCGSDAARDDAGSAATSGFYEPPPAESGFDPMDPANDLLPESNEAEEAFVQQLGRRRDFRIPRRVASGLAEGPLARAVVARIWHELETPYEPDPRYKRLTAGQRALYALQWADAEILNGGFDQFWSNSTGYFAADLVEAAHRVGAPEFEALFGDAAALFPNGRIPRDQGERERLVAQIDPADVAALDERYFEFQYRRRTALGLILGRYVRAHPDEFFV